jgi:lincosamide nucleotidyltransferase A/C/D/E
MLDLKAGGVDACVGGGWAIDALVGEQTREHADLDLWVEAREFEGLCAVFSAAELDRLYPWGGDRPWNFVLHDGASRRVDLHLYEDVNGRFQYGSARAPFTFTDRDLSGEGEILGTSVRCEHPEFALRNHSGYELRAVDQHDIALLCDRFGFELP